MSAKGMNLPLELPPLHRVQREVRDCGKRFVIFRAGRQIGKSTVAAVLAVMRAFSKDDQFIVVLAPTYKQTKAIYDKIVKLLRPLINKTIAGQTIVKEYRSEDSLIFFNGSKIIAATAEKPDRLRGYSIDYVIIDEAAVIDNGWEMWVEILRPALAVTRGDALFISTPKGKVNWFYDLEQFAKADIAENGEASEWYIKHAKSTDSPYFPEEEAETARKLGENFYLQEYEAEFTATKDQMISEDRFNYYSTTIAAGTTYLLDGANTHEEDRLHRVMTVDLALTTKTTSDFTVFAIGDLVRDGTCFVRDVQAQKVLGPDLAISIKRYAEKNDVQVLYVESTAFQLSVVQSLQRMGVTVSPLTAKGDKIARATLLSVRMMNKQMLFQREATWMPATMDELTSFPDGVHDDRVDALAYLAHVSAEYSGKGGPVNMTSITLDQVAAGQEMGLSRKDMRQDPEAYRHILENRKRSDSMMLEKMRGRSPHG